MFGLTKAKTPAGGVEHDWLRQMFAGTIHNIGNVVTVARLAVNDLEEGASGENTAVLGYLLDELLPELEAKAADGTIGTFLCEDPQGREYLGSLRKLLEHQREVVGSQRETVHALAEKLTHLSEVIILQQRLLAGLGTREQVLVDNLLANALKMMTESANRHQVRISFEFGKTPLVTVDPTMMTQVFINLLKNAIEALDQVRDRERLITLRSQVTESYGHRQVICEVADNGPGIPGSVMGRLFEFGFTTKGGGGEGRGVGLHYCRKTVESLGGKITVTSTPGEGSVFSVILNSAEP